MQQQENVNAFINRANTAYSDVGLFYLAATGASVAALAHAFAITPTEVGTVVTEVANSLISQISATDAFRRHYSGEVNAACVANRLTVTLERSWTILLTPREQIEIEHIIPYFRAYMNSTPALLRSEDNALAMVKFPVHADNACVVFGD
jgi:hypothetical protein